MEARAPIHADLPEYQEPSLATKEREIVARLTLLPDSLIDHVDENVRACKKCNAHSRPRRLCAKTIQVCRLGPWSQESCLTDKHIGPGQL